MAAKNLIADNDKEMVAALTVGIVMAKVLHDGVVPSTTAKQDQTFDEAVAYAKLIVKRLKELR